MRPSMVLLCALFFSLVSTQSTPSFGGTLACTMGYRVGPAGTFSQFPLAMRSVPLHEDDDYLARNPKATEPLSDTSLIFHRPSTFDFTALFGKGPIGIGPVVSLHINPRATVDSDQRYQQNQGGTAERGYGTSLRWYQPIARTFQLGLQLQCMSPWLRFGKTVRCRAGLGGIADVTGLRIGVASGWDRYDRDENWKTTTVGVFREHRLLLRFELLATDADVSQGSEFLLYVETFWPVNDYRSMTDEGPVFDQKSKAGVLSGGIGFAI